MSMLYDADGNPVGRANPGVKVMLADAFYVPERVCRMDEFTGLVTGRLLSGIRRCSECGTEVPPDCDPLRYCPNCGARIVGDGE